MQFVFDRTDVEELEIHYAIEPKKSNGQNHIHCYIKCTNKKALMSMLKLGFSNMSYFESIIYDLSGWRAYISKQAKITTLKKQQNANN